jgi:hypothetical protein
MRNDELNSDAVRCAALSVPATAGPFRVPCEDVPGLDYVTLWLPGSKRTLNIAEIAVYS